MKVLRASVAIPVIKPSRMGLRLNNLFASFIPKRAWLSTDGYTRNKTNVLETFTENTHGLPPPPPPTHTHTQGIKTKMIDRLLVFVEKLSGSDKDTVVCGRCELRILILLPTLLFFKRFTLSLFLFSFLLFLILFSSSSKPVQVVVIDSSRLTSSETKEKRAGMICM